MKPARKILFAFFELSSIALLMALIFLGKNMPMYLFATLTTLTVICILVAQCVAISRPVSRVLFPALMCVIVFIHGLFRRTSKFFEECYRMKRDCRTYSNFYHECQRRYDAILKEAELEMKMSQNQRRRNIRRKSISVK